MIRHHRVRRAASLAVALLLVGTTSSCGGDGPGDRAEPPSSPSAESAESSEPSETAEPSETEAGVEPATGRVYETPEFTMRAPKGWRVEYEITDAIEFTSGPPPGDGQASEADPFGLVTVETEAESGPLSLDEVARGSTDDLRRLADTELGGEAAYLLASNQAAFSDQELGLWYDGVVVRLRFTLGGGAKADRQALVDSVVAAWEWK
jgi:hypothetical protein